VDDRLLAVCLEKGVFLKSEASDLGYADKVVTALVRAGMWHRVRRGAYTMGSIWRSASPEERHRIRTRAVMRSLGRSVAVSNVTSMVLRGTAVWGVDLSRVHVTRLDGASGGIEADVVHHEGVLGPDDVEELDGLLMVRSARGLIEATMGRRVEPGLVMADSALHLGIVELEDFHRAFIELKGLPGTRPAQLVVRLADGRAESPGESRVRYACWQEGLPRPELQYPVYDDGELVGTTDFAWEDQKLLGEFDGQIKYGRLLKPGQHPGEVVFVEKRREDRMREVTGWGMVRFVWDELSDPRAVASRVRRLFRRSA